ncbi:MAG: oligosaccharide flippase family protein [Gemmatimonadales bacterium]
MTRTGRILGGVAMGYVQQTVLTLVGLWLTAFLLGRLGEADYGMWLAATQLLGILLLLDLGVVALVPRETAFATGAGGHERSTAEVALSAARSARLVRWQWPGVAAAALLAWWMLPDQWEVIRDPLGLVLLAFVVLFPARLWQAVLNGLQDLAWLGGASLATWLAGTALTVVLLLLELGLMALAVGWVLQSVGNAALWWWRLHARFPEAVPRGPAAFAPGMLRDRLARSAWVSVAQVANILTAGADLLLIGHVLGPAAVVPYFCTAKVATVLGHQVKAIALASQPALAELRVAESQERVALATRALTQVLLLGTGLVACVVLTVNAGFVSWWVGSEQYAGPALTLAILAAMFVRHWNTGAVHGLFAFAEDRRISLTALAEGVATVLITLALLPRIGVLGAAIALAAATLLVSIPFNGAAIVRALGPSGRGLVTDLVSFTWRFLPLAALCTLVGERWQPGTLPALVLATLGSGAIFVALFLPLARRGPLGVYLEPRLARRRWRRG